MNAIFVNPGYHEDFRKNQVSKGIEHIAPKPLY